MTQNLFLSVEYMVHWNEILKIEIQRRLYKKQNKTKPFDYSVYSCFFPFFLLFIENTYNFNVLDTKESRLKEKILKDKRGVVFM